MKKIFAVFAILILTGCAVNVDVNVNDELKVKEKINVSFSNSLADNFLSVSDYVDDQVGYYYGTFSNEGYDRDFKQGESESNILFERNLDNICNLVKSSFSEQLYSEFNCTEDDNYITIQSVGNQKISLPMNMRRFNVQDLNINVTLPIKATDNNADYVNGTTYTWKYDTNTYEQKQFYLKISKVDLKEKIRNEKIDSILGVVKVVSIILVIVSVISFVLYRKYKSNKIKY